MAITTAQIRGARGILNWSQGDLADRTGISATSIGSIENGLTSPRSSTIAIIQKAFEDSGIEFLSNDGVRMRTSEVRIFQGRSGYLSFFEDVYQTLEEKSDLEEIQEIFVSNVDEKIFQRMHGDMAEKHLAKMSSFKNVRYKILVQYGDTNFAASDYAEYRWLPKNMFASVPFYAYGKKLGIMLFTDEPTIITIGHPSVTEAYKLQFKAIWDQSQIPQMEKARA